MMPDAHGRRLLQSAFVSIGIAVAVGCTAFPAVEDARTGYEPRLDIADKAYELDVTVVDPSSESPVDGILVRLTGYRWLNRFHDHPTADFILHAASGEAGAPGKIRFKFPAPPDYRAFDLYLTVYNPRESVPTTHYYPGDLMSLKWLHNDIPLERSKRTASVVISPYDLVTP